MSKIADKINAQGARIAELQAENRQLYEALDRLLSHYCQLVNCGDCGDWNPEKESQVINARAALAAVEGK